MTPASICTIARLRRTILISLGWKGFTFKDATFRDYSVLHAALISGMEQCRHVSQISKMVGSLDSERLTGS